MNDWIEGRLDGAKQAIRFLLSPDRLRQRAFDLPTLLAAMKEIAVPPGGADQEWLLARWEGSLAAYTREAESALSTASTTALDGLADGSESSTLSAGYAWDLRRQMAAVGKQRITDDVGSDTFARTVSHAATVTASTFAAPPKVGKVKAVRFVLSALRGYTAMVWAMVSYLTRGSEFGTRVVNLAIAGGGTLLAVTIFVPSVPIGLTLAGVTLILAGMSAAALLTRGARGLGLRLVVAALLVGGAFGYLVWRGVHEHGVKGDVVTVLVKVGIGALIVLLGWFVATARPSGRK